MPESEVLPYETLAARDCLWSVRAVGLEAVEAGGMTGISRVSLEWSDSGNPGPFGVTIQVVDGRTKTNLKGFGQDIAQALENATKLLREYQCRADLRDVQGLSSQPS